MKDIIISDKNELENKIKRFSEQGKAKLQVISDFDRTLTKTFVNNKKSSTVIAQIRNGKYLTEDYAPRASALFDKYHPIEISTIIPEKEKKKKMYEWWRAHFDLLIECGMNKQVIDNIINKSEIKFRTGSLEFLEKLNINKIPLVIMSAGPGDMIKEHLRYDKRLYLNIHIVANIFRFDKIGKVIGVEEPIIHSLNKHETEVNNLPVYGELLERKNVLLLGDTLEDIGMIEGFPYENLIKIGFLNENIEENLEKYKENYDVVILNDGNFDYINELLKKIVR
jgi:5'-nucleotidase